MMYRTNTNGRMRRAILRRARSAMSPQATGCIGARPRAAPKRRSALVCKRDRFVHVLLDLFLAGLVEPQRRMAHPGARDDSTPRHDALLHANREFEMLQRERQVRDQSSEQRPGFACLPGAVQLIRPHIYLEERRARHECRCAAIQALEHRDATEAIDHL